LRHSTVRTEDQRDILPHSQRPRTTLRSARSFRSKEREEVLTMPAKGKKGTKKGGGKKK